jgi:hypothetical protein
MESQPPLPILYDVDMGQVREGDEVDMRPVGGDVLCSKRESFQEIIQIGQYPCLSKQSTIYSFYSERNEAKIREWPSPVVPVEEEPVSIMKDCGQAEDSIMEEILKEFIHEGKYMSFLFWLIKIPSFYRHDEN